MTLEKQQRYKEENFIPKNSVLEYQNLEVFKAERIRLIEEYLFNLFELK